MKQRILTMAIFGFIINFSSTSIVHATTISLDMNSLPSSQGWTYSSSAGLSETDISGGVLTTNTLGQGWGAGSGYLQNGVVTLEPFTLSVRTRVLQEEIFNFGPAQALQFNICGNGKCYSFALGPSNIKYHDGTGANLFTSFDNTQFHDYVLQGTPEMDSSYTLTIDDTHVINGIAESYPGLNSILFGDLSSAGNGLSEIASLTFSQGTTAPVPEPSTMLLFGTGIAGLACTIIRRNKK